MKRFDEWILTEMPQYYQGNITYQKDNKFQPISVRNLYDYTIMGDSMGLVYAVHPNRTFGFVFDFNNQKQNDQFITPVMHLSLRDTIFGDYRQAHNLRIKQSYSKTGIASNWYDFYIKSFGGIVSDREHLEGGKTLWISFIKKATNNSSYRISLADSTTGDILEKVTSNTPEDNIWSKDKSKKDIVLIYEYISSI